MGFLSELIRKLRLQRRWLREFGRNQSERFDQIEKRHAAAAAKGLLPPPRIVVSHDCACGRAGQFDMANLDLEHGLNSRCAWCGAILHVPPTVLDHTEYWEAGQGASLVSEWRAQMRFISR